MITSSAFANKHYAVLGLARSGRATVEALLASGARVTAWDDNQAAREALSSYPAEARADFVIADFTKGDLSQFDSIVVTPGLPLNRHPIAQRARNAGVEIIGDIELFARARPDLPPHKVVGITGTNGKSTTTALVHHILATAGVPSLMGGNIGLPILAQEPLPEGGVYVLELSSYQIDLTKSLDCDIAVLLNITPDHLDRYDDFEAYSRSKQRLFELQSVEHLALGAEDDDEADETFYRLQHGDVSYPKLRHFHRAEVAHYTLSPVLAGGHNGQNAAAALNACRALGGICESVIEAGLKTFPGLPHRMERVAERGGVLFVNDSKATNPTATAPALAAFSGVRWILGGQAKSDNLDECAPHFGNVRSAYAIGEAADLYERLLKPHMPVKNCGDLGQAVKQAAADAEAGDTVLLSPACASFDQFSDFEARGDAFRRAVEAL